MMKGYSKSRQIWKGPFIGPPGQPLPNFGSWEFIPLSDKACYAQHPLQTLNNFPGGPLPTSCSLWLWVFLEVSVPHKGLLRQHPR